jgi:hypothetical protein
MELNPSHQSAKRDGLYFYFSAIMVGSSEYLCSAGGVFCSHSTEFFVFVGNRIFRFVLVLSHVMKVNINTLTNKLVDT